MSDQPNQKLLPSNKTVATDTAIEFNDGSEAFKLDFNSVASVPWYYKVLIKLLKPIYRFALWRRYKKRIKHGLLTANYDEEINARFGLRYPNPPQHTLDVALTTSNPEPNQASSSSDSTGSDSTGSDSTGSDSVNVNKAIYSNVPRIWCHAVSLGETNTIAPMISVLLKKGATVWMTNTTQTGYARTYSLFAEAIATEQLVHTFVPIDDEQIVKNFLTIAQPDLAMFIETELWATTLEVLKRLSIPSVLVNGRLSHKSFNNYRKFGAVSRSMMSNLTMIIAQDALSASRFIQLGADENKVKIADSLKWSTGMVQSNARSHSEHVKPFVQQTDTDELLKSELTFATDETALNRPIWVAGSTHEGEESIVLKAHQHLISQKGLNETVLILVPRHPERFDAVVEMVDKTGLTFHRRSKGELINRETQVYIADTMGELTLCYQLSDVAFVGGSLANIGGHNPVEAASFAKPIIMGQYTQSCDEVVDALLAVGALKVVMSSNDSSNAKATEASHLANHVSAWLLNTNDSRQAGKKGYELVRGKKDAMQTQLKLLETVLSEKFVKSHHAISCNLDEKI